eukprot:GILK01013256.1.p1 GENE.GILK01013256.1~~GILK01013256.1.p1  ORF type:complete len:1088 (+),score=189.66 GILK01013256.1:43-3264(+)
MQKHRAVTLERLDLLATGKSYPAQDAIAIKHWFYLDKRDVTLEVARNTDRIPFSQVRELSFSSSQIGDVFGPSWSTHWFKVRFTVPSEWDAKEVHLLWDSSSEATLWSVEGLPLQGFNGSDGNDRRDEFILSQSIKGSSSYSFFIEMACNGMFGQDHWLNPQNASKTYPLRKAEIAVFDRDAWDVNWDYITLVDAAKFLPTASAMNARALRIANAISNYVATHPRDAATWKHCRKLAAEFLSLTNGMGQHNVTAVGHCHIDTAWLWPYAETRRKCARSWSTQLCYMDLYPSYTFCASQAQQFDWVKFDYPLLYEKIQQKTAEGKFIPVGGTWVEMDGNLPSGESFARQFLYGQRFFRKEFNKTCREFFMPDTFGYAAQLPQIMRESGIEYFLTQKLSWNMTNKIPHSTFLWEGIDGSKVLAHFPPADSYTANGRLKEVLMSVSNFKDLDRVNSSLILFGHGDGGGGPKMEMIETLQRLHNLNEVPEVSFGSVDTFFDTTKETAKDLCTWVGELYFELHRGTYTSQAVNKLQNRFCEFLLRDSELYSSLALALSAPVGTVDVPAVYPAQELERLWKLVLLNQFHDVLPGSSIQEVYSDSAAHYKEVRDLGSSIRDDSISVLNSKLAGTFTPNETDATVEEGYMIWNSCSFNRIEVIELKSTSNRLVSDWTPLQVDHNGNALALVEVPPMGYSFFNGAELTRHQNRLLTTPCNVHQDATKFILTNGYVRVTVNAKGQLESVYDLIHHRESIQIESTANQFVIFDDLPFYWDAWDVMEYHLETRQPINEGTVTILENGPLRVSLRISVRISEVSSLTQIMSLSSSSPRIDFDTTVDWHENRKFLKVEFPLAIRSSVASYEIAFGHLQRPTHFNTSWDVARFEVCGSKWADLSEFGYGVALLNNCKYGYATHGNVLRLSLLRSPKAPDPTCDMGQHRFTYSLLPHKSSLQEGNVIQHGYALNIPLQIRTSEFATAYHSRSFFQLSTNSVMLETVKLCEDYGSHETVVLVLRLYEAFGGRCDPLLTVTLPVTRATRCNFLEDDSEDLKMTTNENASESVIRLSFKPFQIVTLKLHLKS